MKNMVNKHQNTVNELRARLNKGGKVSGAEVWMAFCLLGLYLLIICSYIGNIVQLVIASKAGITITLLIVLKIVGIIVPPLGILLGFLGFFGF